MTRFSRSRFFPSSRIAAAIVALFLAAIAVGPLVQLLHVGIREIAILGLIVITLPLIFMPTDRVLRFGFTLWILTFALGWRTIYLTPNLNIHPTEVIVWILFISVIAQSAMKNTSLDFSLPLEILCFMLFAFLGLATAFLAGQKSDIMLQEFKVFFAIPFVYYVVRWSIRSKQDWERAVRWAIVVAVYISCLGLMDNFTPGLSQALASGEGVSSTYLAQSYQGAAFTRVGFVFFGNFTAGFVIFTFLGFTIHYLLDTSWSAGSRLRRLIPAILLAIQFAGIYLSGYRGLWYAGLVFLGIYALLQRRALSVIVLGALVLPLLPIDFFNRFQSVFNPEFADSSQYDRIFRASYAFDLFQRSPLMGVGWGGSGYVHSDLIQIAANLGIFGIGFFLAWILGILWRLFKLTRRQDWIQGYARVLLAMVFGLLIVFSGEGMISFIQLTIPIWFLFAMSDRLTEMSKQTSEIANASLASTLIPSSID